MATQNLYEVTKEFLEQEKKRVIFEDIWTAQSDAILANVDIEDTWFSLKDVMELTLLHTQQLHMIETRNA